MPDKKLSEIDEEIHNDFMEGRDLTVYQVGNIIAEVNAKLQVGVAMMEMNGLDNVVGFKEAKEALTDLQMVMCQDWLFRNEPVSAE